MRYNRPMQTIFEGGEYMTINHITTEESARRWLNQRMDNRIEFETQRNPAVVVQSRTIQRKELDGVDCVVSSLTLAC